MRNLSPFLLRASYLTLAAGLLGTGHVAAQTTAQVYVLLNQVSTAGGTAVVAATQGVNTLNISYGPASSTDPTPTVVGTGFVTATPKPLMGLTTASGLTSAQVIVAIDTRPNTGVLYALGYDATKPYDDTQASKNAQLYTLNPTNGQLTAVGPGFSVDLQDNNRNNTKGFLPNVGFDFNPRADRLRIVGPNRTDYRVNPNTGTLAAVDGTLTYVSGSQVPYVGSVAYTNSLPGIPGTTLYDLDISAGKAAKLAIQDRPNDGTLTSQGQLMFQVNAATSYSQLASPVIGLDLDILYQNGQNVPLLLEARFSAEDNTDQSQGYASNLYVLNTSSGLAKGNNLFGKSSTFISNIAAVTGPQKLWNGTISTDWATAGNWTPSGIPGNTDNVVIPGPGGAVVYQPTLASTQQVSSLILIAGLNNSTSVVTLADGSDLQVFGDFTNNDGALATPAGASGTGKVTLAGTRAQEIGGPTATTFPNLVVGSGTTATTSAGVAIIRSVTATGNLTIGSGQLFTLRSNASGTAYAVNNGGNISGIATVQRYITPFNSGLGYRHYSSPVSKASGSTTSNTVADLSTTNFTPVVNGAYNSATTPRQTSPYPTVFYYDQSRLATSNDSYAVGDFDNGFLSPAALTDTLAPARGYTVNIPGTALVDFQGKLRSGNYSSGTLTRGAQIRAGYHLLGNPYPGAISYTTVYNASTGIQDGLYVYRSSGQYTGSYSTYLSNGQSVNGGTDNVPLAQGFFVRVAAGGSGQVNFTNAARTNAPEIAPFLRTAGTAPALALTLRGNGAANQTRVYFDKDATSGYDNARDGFYLPASHGLDLASDLSPEALSINGLPELTGATTVPLRLHAPVAGTYTLAVDELANLPAGYRAYLRDASTSTYTDLTTTPSVSLALTPGEAATGRFALLFTSASPLAATAPAALAALAAVYPSPAHGTATLVLPQALRGNSASTVQLINTLGQVVLTKTVAAGSGLTVELPLVGIAPGIYTVRATTEAGLVAKRLVVQ